MRLIPTADGLCFVLSQIEQQGVGNVAKLSSVPNITPRIVLDELAQRYSHDFAQDITDIVMDLEKPVAAAVEGESAEGGGNIPA